MEGKKLLHSISLKNLLSYGSEGVTLDLEPLNVLIGPNASGKSNLIEAISLLAAAPRNLLAPFRDSGFAEDWLWKGKEASEAEIEASFELSEDGESLILFYSLLFGVQGIRLDILSESLGTATDRMNFFYRDRNVARAQEDRDGQLQRLYGIELDPQQSLFVYLKNAAEYPFPASLGDLLGKIRFFRGWPFGRNNILRKPQDVHLPDDFLLEDGSNLGLILNDLQNRRDTKLALLEALRLLYEDVEDVTTKVQGGTIQVFFHERGLERPVPAYRLSDGTLHFLCLLTVLLHPDPPPLVCIEEPEIGLHPDVILTVARLLVEASQRTQLIITTHSETLVSALSETPETVVVCERDDRGTSLKRLDPKKLKDWLEEYRLGDLWAMGEIGGNR